MESAGQRRHYIRFNPEALEVAIASLNETDFRNYDPHTEDFHGDLVGLIMDQSFKGASIVFANKEKSDSFLPIGFRCILKVGELSPLPAEIRWREVLAADLVKVGFEFLE